MRPILRTPKRRTRYRGCASSKPSGLSRLNIPVAATFVALCILGPGALCASADWQARVLANGTRLLVNTRSDTEAACVALVMAVPDEFRTAAFQPAARFAQVLLALSAQVGDAPPCVAPLGEAGQAIQAEWQPGLLFFWVAVPSADLADAVLALRGLLEVRPDEAEVASVLQGTFQWHPEDEWDEVVRLTDALWGKTDDQPRVGVSVSDALAILRRCQEPQNVTVAVAGAVDANAALELLVTAFGQRRPGEARCPVSSPPTAVSFEAQASSRVPAAHVSAVMVGEPGPEGWQRAQALGVLLAGGHLGRLYRKARLGQGLLYRPAWRVQMVQGRAVLVVICPTAQQSLPDLSRAIAAQLAELAVQGPTQTELDAVHTYLTGQHAGAGLTLAEQTLSATQNASWWGATIDTVLPNQIHFPTVDEVRSTAAEMRKHLAVCQFAPAPSSF